MNARRSDNIDEPSNPQGSNENIRCWKAGQLDIGAGAGEQFLQPSWAIGRPATKLKIPTACIPVPAWCVVRAIVPYKTIRDPSSSRGVRRQGLGPADPVANTCSTAAEKQDEDFKVDLSRPSRRRTGDVQTAATAALWGAGSGWPGFEAMAKGRVAHA